MATTKRTTAVGVFVDREQAQKAVEALRQAGFREDQIGVAARDERRAGDGEEETYAEEGAVAGAAAGAGLGSLWAIGIAAGALPAIGPIIAGGVLGSLLLAATGAAVGGLVGGLVGLGIPERGAKYYEKELHSGRTIVTVKADGRYDEAAAILRRFEGYNMYSRKTIPVREERLRVRKQPTRVGEVKVRKETHTEHRTLEVPVRREEVVVERRPARGRRAASADIGASEEIRVPVREEQVWVEKEPVVTEEVTVGKRAVADTEQVSGTVRKEKVRVDTEGDAHVRGGTAGEACSTGKRRSRSSRRK